MQSIGWLVLGTVVGALGTLIGAGGGFLLVPALLLLSSRDRPETITAISLAVVFLNALSGSIAYARMRRIDVRSGILFAAFTIPGAILGALTTERIPRRTFDVVFGVLLALTGVAMLAMGTGRPRGPAPARDGHAHRVIVEADGTRHEYTFRPLVGVAISLVVGYVSSLLGIGGGIIHVPALVYVLGFPAHVATATSHFILVFMALAGSGVHLATGALQPGLAQAAWIGAGAIIGAQAGARWSGRVHARWIIRGLALGLILVALRILTLPR